MTGRKRNARVSRTVDVVCTDRGQHERVLLRVLTAQVADGAEVHLVWDTRLGQAPVTGHRDAEGWNTFEFRCTQPGCRQHFKRGERQLVKDIRLRAAVQNVTGNMAVEFDISLIGPPT